MIDMLAAGGADPTSWGLGAVASLALVAAAFGAYRSVISFRNGHAQPMFEPRLGSLEARADAHDEAETRQWDKLEDVAEDVSYIRGRIDGLPCLRDGCPGRSP